MAALQNNRVFIIDTICVILITSDCCYILQITKIYFYLTPFQVHAYHHTVTFYFFITNIYLSSKIKKEKSRLKTFHLQDTVKCDYFIKLDCKALCLLCHNHYLGLKNTIYVYLTILTSHHNSPKSQQSIRKVRKI